MPWITSSFVLYKCSPSRYQKLKEISIRINHRIKRKKHSQNSAPGIYGPFFKILELGWVNLCPRRGRKITEEVQCSHSVMSDSLQPHGLQHASLPCPSPSPGVYWNSCPSSWWCHPSYPLWSPSPPAFNLSQHQGLFKWVSSSHQVDKIWEFQLQHQSFQWIFRTDFL